MLDFLYILQFEIYQKIFVKIFKANFSKINEMMKWNESRNYETSEIWNHPNYQIYAMCAYPYHDLVPTRRTGFRLAVLDGSSTKHFLTISMDYLDYVSG